MKAFFLSTWWIVWGQYIAAIGAIVLVTCVFAWLLLVQGAKDPCWHTWEYRCKAQQVQSCIDAELYTRDECFMLIGGINK